MSRTYRNTNPRTIANGFHTDDIHIHGDGTTRTDKHAGWMLDYGKERGSARKDSARRMRAAERRGLDAIRAHGVDPDEIVWPKPERTEGWMTH